jgi:ADP-ribose pyrophosphatase
MAGGKGVDEGQGPDRPVYKGKNFVVYRTLVEVAPGRVEEHEYVWRSDGTRIVVLNDTNEVLLTREYRHELQQEDWRIPGGKIDPGEVPEEAARRELREETGYAAGELRYLWASTLDSTVRYRRHFYLATQVSLGSSHADPGESIVPHWLPLDEACDLALSGAISEEIAALALLRVRQRLAVGAR